jgi:ABC-2 type transport system permease protein
MKALSAIVRKEFIHVLRDSRTLRLVIFMPLFQLLLYGYGINTDVKHLSMWVLDEDNTPLSRRLTEALVQSAFFDVTARPATPEGLKRGLDRGDAKAGLHIPPGFMRDALAGRPVSIRLAVDGSDSSPANTAVSSGQLVVGAFLQKEGLAAVPVTAVDFRPRLWYNPDLKSAYFMVPGVVGLLLQLLIPMITASAVVREKERGNIEQLLVSPVTPMELMVGKMVPYVVIGLVIASTVLTVAHFLFEVPIRGGLLTLYALTLLYITVCLGIGLWASTISENQQQASQVVMFFAAPSILLSGFIFPRETMPAPIHALGQLIPLTYFLRIIRGITLKGLGFADLWPQIWPLALMAAGILFLSVKKFHKRLS